MNTWAGLIEQIAVHSKNERVWSTNVRLIEKWAGLINNDGLIEKGAGLTKKQRFKQNNGWG